MAIVLLFYIYKLVRKAFSTFPMYNQFLLSFIFSDSVPSSLFRIYHLRDIDCEFSNIGLCELLVL